MKRIKVTSLNFGLYQKGGRSNTGQITVSCRGSLVKRLYRFLDTKRRLWSFNGATILSPYVYDANRSSHISLIMLPNGILTYVLAAQYPLHQEQIFNLNPPKNMDIGSSMYLKDLKNGTLIFNCEIHPSMGGQILRAAGVSGLLLKKLSTRNLVYIKLKSGAIRAVSRNCISCIGVVSNPDNFLQNFLLAGKTRRKGWRPHIRPSAQNPVDNKMGGRTKGGICSRNKNGILTGSPTAKKKMHALEITSSRFYKLKKQKKIKL